MLAHIMVKVKLVPDSICETISEALIQYRNESVMVFQ